MSAYAGTGKAKSLECGQQLFAFQNEAVSVGESSLAFRIHHLNDPDMPRFSVEITFSAAPGAFQIDIQTADTDDNGHYVTLQSVSGGLNGSNVCRAEITAVWARYMRLNVVALANAVNVTAMVRR